VGSEVSLIRYIGSEMHRGQHYPRTQNPNAYSGEDDRSQEVFSAYHREYRGTVFMDPSSLAQQVPFYSIRVAYVESLWVIFPAHWGESWLKASWIIRVQLIPRCLRRGIYLIRLLGKTGLSYARSRLLRSAHASLRCRR
jgi:hypothetical protein